MQFDKLTTRAQEALQAAQRIATTHRHQQLENEHVLAAVLEQDDGIVPSLVRAMGADPAQLRTKTQNLIDKIPAVHGAESQLYLSAELKETFDAAVSRARDFKDEYISIEHIFLAMVEQKRGAVAAIFKEAGINKLNVRKQLEELRGPHRVTDQDPESKY
ncbi:MAG: Clp protease N-terminal domain-containing protein, partial [Planctomycetota bacterium]